MEAAAERVEQLPAAPSSAVAARRFLRRTLAEWGHEGLTESAELLVTEVVTNAVLHAGTDIDLRALGVDTGVRVEVHDRSPVVPAVRHYSDRAVTGRGLGLVDALASDWGIDQTSTGKAVWFHLGDADELGAPGETSAKGRTGAPTRRVHLLGVPAALVHATLEYGDAVLRELMLLSMAGELGDDVAPVYTTPELDLSPVLTGVEAALAGGRPASDLDATFPLTAAEAAVERLALVDEADRLAQEDRLLTPPAVPEVGHCRRWLMTEIAVQLRGSPPTPWALPPIGEDHVDPEPLTDAEQRALCESHSAVVVADSRNRIVFVSEAAAGLLGWTPEELAGRRLTTVIPPDLRERHLAGFTRYHVTEETRLLGRPVNLRALRRDGSEVAVELRIDEVQRSGARKAFRAVFRGVH